MPPASLRDTVGIKRNATNNTHKRRSGKNEKMRFCRCSVLFRFYRLRNLLHPARGKLLGRGSGVFQSPDLAGISDIQAARVSENVNNKFTDRVFHVYYPFL